MKDAVKFAHDILDMQERIFKLEADVAYFQPYEKKFLDLQRQDIEHNQKMLGGILQIAMTPGVMEAIGKSHETAEIKP